MICLDRKTDHKKILAIIEKIYEISGKIGKCYIDDLIGTYDEIFLSYDNDVLKSIAIVEHDIDNVKIKLISSVSGNGMKLLEEVKILSKSRGYKCITLDSVFQAYGFYRKSGFICKLGEIDSMWDNLVGCNISTYNKRTLNIEKRIIKNQKCKSKVFIERVSIEKKVAFCKEYFEGDVKKMYLRIGDILPREYIPMVYYL